MRSVRWSPSRVATGIVLGAWAALFWFLLVSGRWSLYLSTRTFWVVPTGAVLLTIAAVGRLATARVDAAGAAPERRPRGRSAWSPSPWCCSWCFRRPRSSGYALGRRSGFVGSGVSVSTSDIASGTISFIDVAAAQSSKSGMAALRSRAGEQVTLEGFVWRSRTGRRPTRSC